MKWIGAHIWDFISRFRNKVYLEGLDDPGSDTDKFLVIDANDKIGYRTGAEVLSDIGASAEASDLEISNASDNRIVTSSGGTDLNGETNFTFDGTNLDLTSTSTTADIFDITGNSLTTGSFIHYAQQDSTTTGFTNTGLVDIDFQTLGVLGTGQTKSVVGQKTQLLSGAINHSGSTFALTGHDINVSFADSTGTTSAIGLDVRTTGAASSTGLLIDTPDGLGDDIKILSSANSADYFTIKTATDGETTMTTVEDGVGTTAHLNFVVDGDITANSTNFDIGQSTDGVKITNGTSSGGPALEIDNDDADEIALYIPGAANTTASVVQLASAAITTGKMIDSVSIPASTSSFDHVAHAFTIIKAGITGDGATVNLTGLRAYATDSQTNHANSTVNLIGAEILAQQVASNQGTISTVGTTITATGGDTNTGITTTVDDGGVDLKCLSSADTGDYFSLSTTTHGATTLATIDDDATAAHLTLDADGDVILDAHSKNIYFKYNGTSLLHYDMNAYTATWGGDNDAGVTIARQTHSDGNGGSMTIQGGNATSGQTDKTGGALILKGGQSTGAVYGGTIEFHASSRASTGGTLNAVNKIAELSVGTADTRFKIFENAGSSVNDYFLIDVNASGATVISTVDAAGSSGDLTMDPDGELIFESNFSKISTNWNFASVFENQYSSGNSYGDILKYSPGASDTLTAGKLYFLHTDGTWDETDADAVATGASQLLGIGKGASGIANGVLIRGFVRVPSTEILNTPGSGAVDGLPVYVSTTAGHLDFTAPSGSGDFVRIVGYAIDDYSSDVLLYFDPDKTWIEIA